MIDPRFLPHNQHHRFPDEFAERDPQLLQLDHLRFVHRFELLDALLQTEPGIYSLTGGRQIGKSTLMKQWMAELLEHSVRPELIVYLTGELIDDHHALVRIVQSAFPENQGAALRYLCIDEVTYIRDWDRGIKFLADAGILRNTVVVVTGSDSVLVAEARLRLPGRRGASVTYDFHLFPLSFYDYVSLTGAPAPEVVEELIDGGEPVAEHATQLRSSFERYLATGGYLSGINSLHAYGAIDSATYTVYAEWIRGDMIKRGKQERYLRDVLQAIVRRMGSQVTWNALSADLSIDHPATVADYVDLLSRMDVLVVLPALVEHRLSAAPKKARKVVFADPFIYHAVRSWLEPSRDPYQEQVLPVLSDPSRTGSLAELCVDVHHARRRPTYYIKAEGEVDVAYVERKRFYPIEVKWAGQVRAKDIKQLGKYPNGRLVSAATTTMLHGVPNEFLPLHLLRLGPSPYVVP